MQKTKAAQVAIFKDHVIY